ncbi:MAG TPA: hypothetical protein VIG78_10530 [Gemmatimonadaceae bacterium]
MKKPLRITLWIVGSIAAGFVLLAFFGMWSLSHMGYAFADGDLPSHLEGRWDWSTHAHYCGDSAHVIAFAPDRKTMTISMPPSATDTGWTATYDILSLGASRLRGASRGETRLTDKGVPVVWDLVLFGPDEYHWHRADWQSWMYTAGVRRCGSKTVGTPRTGNS